MSHSPLVSIHGGHSGQFCSHAQDTLEEMINAYVGNGFAWVGITEHMPPTSDRFSYPEELAGGLDARAQYNRFATYIRSCRELQARYKDRIRIFVGFETETYRGSRDWIRQLMGTFSPDYIVGSVHHVNDLPFDTSKADYDAAVENAGGTDALYKDYFDQQYRMLDDLKPDVVGHMDIIRIHDPDYRERIVKPEIWQLILRNLKRIADFNLIMDYNLRPLSKGFSEPYPSLPILRAAIDMGIAIVPGDDSHEVADIATHIHGGIAMLRSAGYARTWQTP